MTANATLGYPLVQRTLDNGLRVIVNPDHAAPVVAVNLWYDVGSRDEDPGASGFAHLFEHLMFQGSANVRSGEHLAALQAAGASVNATTWFDRTNYFEAVPTGALDLALWLESDRMATLPVALTQANLDNQRDVVKEEKRQRYDNVPYGDVIEHALALTFPAGHPYGHPVIGSMADLDAATTESAASFFRRYYHPGNCVLTLAGDIEPDDGFTRAERYFGALPAGPTHRRPPAEPLPPLAGVPRVTLTQPVPQDAVYLTWRLPARGTRAFDASDIALDILGGSQTSRLYRALVRDGGLASGAGASAMGLIGGTSLGLAFARALDGVRTGALEDAIDAELRRFGEEGPTADELERTRVQFEREWLSQLARVETRADLIGGYAVLHGDPGLVNTRIAEFGSVTAEEVRDAARTWLQPEQRAAITYRRGPLGGGEE
nr:insulinase family protein [Propionibacterium sp.]